MKKLRDFLIKHEIARVSVFLLVCIYLAYGRLFVYMFGKLGHKYFLGDILISGVVLILFSLFSKYVLYEDNVKNSKPLYPNTGIDNKSNEAT